MRPHKGPRSPPGPTCGRRRNRSLVGARRRCRAGGKAMGRTLAEKVWDDHVVRRAEGEPDLLF
ncbi:hypothetical protein, partial [Streptomyces sp. NPDC007883]|uniref:hypothetical protein n=1 Tax=unclassified Streptomyces TaxID=2593676 RepID=UPI003403E49E